MSNPGTNTYGYHDDNNTVCARHPDRLTYVRCGRCGRYTCGDCQVPLEVGMMCTDCMAAARAASPKIRYATTKPVVTYTLIGITAAIWLLQWTFPAVTIAGIYNPTWVEYSGEWYRALTSGFLHSLNNLTHLPFNMFSLYLFGQALEPILGRWKFLTLYLASILGGSLTVHLLASVMGTMDVSTLGASGGVFGLFGAFFALAKARQQNTSSIMILIVINLVYGFVFPGVSWEAHLGGLITGTIVATLLNALPQKQARR